MVRDSKNQWIYKNICQKFPWVLLSIDHLKTTAESNYIPKTPVTITYNHNVSTNNYLIFIFIVFIIILYVDNWHRIKSRRLIN